MQLATCHEPSARVTLDNDPSATSFFFNVVDLLGCLETDALVVTRHGVEDRHKKTCINGILRSFWSSSEPPTSDKLPSERAQDCVFACSMRCQFLEYPVALVVQARRETSNGAYAFADFISNCLFNSISSASTPLRLASLRRSCSSCFARI